MNRKGKVKGKSKREKQQPAGGEKAAMDGTS